jgi:hypothetical protein
VCGEARPAIQSADSSGTGRTLLGPASVGKPVVPLGSSVARTVTRSAARSAGSSFLVTVVGPISSFVLAGLFWALQRPFSTIPNPAGAVLGFLAFVNLMLGAFNLVPGFPWTAAGASVRWLGARLAACAVQLRSLRTLVRRTMDRVHRLVPEHRRRLHSPQQVIEEHLRGMRVTQVMDAKPTLVPPGVSVHDFVFDDVLQRGAAMIEAETSCRALLIGRPLMTNVVLVSRHRIAADGGARART